MVRVALIGLCIGALGCQSAEPARPPNLIVVDIDTLRADRLGVYGATPSPSPRLDALAASAVVFEWAFATAPYTPPSQTSIVTGLHPNRHGVWSRHEQIPRRAATLPEMFRDQGYRTVGLTGGGYVSGPFGFGRGFDEFEDSGLGLRQLEDRIAQTLSEQARSPGQPLLLFVHTYHVHTPYDPDGEYRSNWSLGDGPETVGFEPTAEAMEAARRAAWQEPPVLPPPQDLLFARSLYDGEIAEVDAWFGRLLDTIGRLGLRSNTVVAVVSDHGEAFGEHGSVLHETLYTPVTRVPWLVAAPGVEAGRVECAVSMVDFLPTMLELTGLEAPSPPTIDGHSRVEAMAGGPCRSLALSQSGYFRDKPALVLGDLHLVSDRRTGASQLFRYRDDPVEAFDLASISAEQAAHLRLQADRYIAALEARSLPREATNLPRELENQLRALGYTN